MKINYDVIYELSRRAKYKSISEDKNFCYFVFQGVRVEAVRDASGYYMICCCKGGVAKKTNRTDTYNDKIFCMADNLSCMCINVNDEYMTSNCSSNLKDVKSPQMSFMF